MKTVWSFIISPWFKSIPALCCGFKGWSKTKSQARTVCSWQFPTLSLKQRCADSRTAWNVNRSNISIQPTSSYSVFVSAACVCLCIKARGVTVGNWSIWSGSPRFSVNLSSRSSSVGQSVTTSRSASLQRVPYFLNCVWACFVYVIVCHYELQHLSPYKQHSSIPHIQYTRYRWNVQTVSRETPTQLVCVCVCILTGFFVCHIHR